MPSMAGSKGGISKEIKDKLIAVRKIFDLNAKSGTFSDDSPAEAGIAMKEVTSIISGTTFWPLFPFDVVRSELGHQHQNWNEGEQIVCPNKSTNQTCMIQRKKCFYEDCTDHKRRCPYEDYHNYFLLESRDRNIKTIPIQADEFLKNIEQATDHSGLEVAIHNSKEVASAAMNHFPQYKECDNLLAGTLCGAWPSGGRQGNNQLGVMEFWKYPDNDYQASSPKMLSIREKFYIGCEFLGRPEKNGVPVEIAFHRLINISRIWDLLPVNDVNASTDFMVPVWLSFFGDGKLDVLLSLLVRCGNKGNRPGVKNFVAQALGSVAETVKMQRQEFLHQWCRHLRRRLGKIFDDTDDQDVKKAAIYEGIKAIRSMALVLWADNTISSQDVFVDRSILKSRSFEFDYDHKVEFKQCRSEDCWEGKYQDNKDRCNYICDFCRQAKISIEEGFLHGKLKGALSRNTSEELIQIAKDDPVKARVLLQGSPGGGKGVAATDFHAYCMARIAESLDKIKFKENATRRSLAEIAIVLDNNKIQETFKFLDNYWTEVKSAKISYLVQIENVLRGLRDLPAYVEKEKGKDVYDYFRDQIAGTAWWRWANEKDDTKANFDKLNDLISNFRNKVAYPTADDSKEDDQWDWCVRVFLLILGMKLVVELHCKEEADWSFNLFQVNCGIMGGENSELAASILRLFGRGEKNHDMPGIFQTCSYVGGTLFLDEIADAPVRIQDNLLRPLEESKVSRPGWETIDEDVGNVRIVGATFKNLFKLSSHYEETLSSGNARGFRPDLLTRLTRNPPVSVVPIWHHFVPEGHYSERALRDQFRYVMVEATAKEGLTSTFWDEVYKLVTRKIDDHCRIAAKHLPDELDRRRHFASKITMRLFMALKDRNIEDKEALKGRHREYLDRMLDYLLCDS